MSGVDNSSVQPDRRDVLKGAAAAGALLLAPAGVRAATPAPRRGGTLRVSMPYNPGSLDPMTSRNLTDCNVLYGVFDTLIDYEPRTLELKPALAKAWRFSDPKTLVLDLVSGVEFHDGAPFDAAAVKFNFDRNMHDPRANTKADLSSIAAVEVTGKSQVTLHLHRPNAGLPTILTSRSGLMVSPQAVKAHGAAVTRQPVGTGPFKFVSWEDNASCILTRNPNYWRPGLPYLDGIDIRIVTELNTTARTVIAGQADIALDMQVDQKLIADRVKGIVATSQPSLIFFGAFLNYSRPPLNDVRIRQALNYGIDREAINKVINVGLGEPTSAILPKESWACDPATANYYGHDPDRAKKLLADAGHPDGIEIESWGWPFQSAMRRQELIISQLAQAGIRIKLRAVSNAQAMQHMMIEKQRAMLIGPTGGFPDPSQQYEALFGKDALRNAGGVELPGFRPLMDATETALDRATRKAAFAKLQRFVVEQALQMPQFIAANVFIASSKVQGFDVGLVNIPRYAETWLAA
jgi:peptide/nickel transport system substrate-binding protein/glutathione transport system substrate-binding protein